MADDSTDMLMKPSGGPDLTSLAQALQQAQQTAQGANWMAQVPQAAEAITTRPWPYMSNSEASHRGMIKGAIEGLFGAMGAREQQRNNVAITQGLANLFQKGDTGDVNMPEGATAPLKAGMALYGAQLGAQQNWQQHLSDLQQAKAIAIEQAKIAASGEEERKNIEAKDPTLQATRAALGLADLGPGGAPSASTPAANLLAGVAATTPGANGSQPAPIGTGLSPEVEKFINNPSDHDQALISHVLPKVNPEAAKQIDESRTQYATAYQALSEINSAYDQIAKISIPARLDPTGEGSKTVDVVRAKLTAQLRRVLANAQGNGTLRGNPDEIENLIKGFASDWKDGPQRLQIGKQGMFDAVIGNTNPMQSYKMLAGPKAWKLDPMPPLPTKAPPVPGLPKPGSSSSSASATAITPSYAAQKAKFAALFKGVSLPGAEAMTPDNQIAADSEMAP